MIFNGLNEAHMPIGPSLLQLFAAFLKDGNDYLGGMKLLHDVHLILR